jgi:hypothetical protein
MFGQYGVDCDGLFGHLILCVARAPRLGRRCRPFVYCLTRTKKDQVKTWSFWYYLVALPPMKSFSQYSQKENTIC